MSEMPQTAAGSTQERPDPLATATPWGELVEEPPPAPEESRMTGFVIFAGVIMIVTGGFEMLMGLTALFEKSYYNGTGGTLLVTDNMAAWGWTHIALGAVAVAAGFGLFRGALWARMVGILFCMVAAVVNLAFVGVAPVWSISVITLSVVAAYSIMVHGDDLAW